MKYLTIIPARGGSKGIPHKNIKMINGKPLICWSIERSLACSLIDRTVVSTDSAEIAAVGEKSGAEIPFMRPSYLAEDETPTEPVLLHVLDRLYKKERYRPDAVILLQPTSPVRKKNRLYEAIKLFENQGADSLVSVCENHHFFWKNHQAPLPLYNYKARPRRQEIKEEERWYQENGSIYITKLSTLTSGQNRLGGKMAMFVMDEDESYEIDSAIDFKMVEFLLKEHEHDYR